MTDIESIEMQTMIDDTFEEGDGQAQAAPWLSRRAKIATAMLMVASACTACVAVKVSAGATVRGDKGLEELQGKSQSPQQWSFGGVKDYRPSNWVNGASAQYHPDHWALGALKTYKPTDWVWGEVWQFHPKNWVSGSLKVYHPKNWCKGDGSYHPPTGWIGGNTLNYHPVLWRLGAPDGYHPLSWIPGLLSMHHPPTWVGGLLENYHPPDWVEGDLRFYHPCGFSSEDPLADFRKAFAVDSAEDLLALHEAGSPVNHLLGLPEEQFMALLFQSMASDQS